MNRVKVWAYSVIVAAVGVAGLRADLIARRAGATAQLDARLAAAAAQVVATTRALATDVAAAAALAGRDERLVQALHPAPAAPPKLLPRKKGRSAPPPPPPVDEEAREAALREAARAALANAERALGHALPEGTAVTTATRDALARKGPPAPNEGDAMAFLRAAVAGKAQRGWIRLNGAAYHAAAAPAGDGAGVTVLAPLDEAWVKAAAAATGVDVTLSVPDVKPVSTLRGDAAQPFSAWTLAPGAAVGIGKLAPAALAAGPVRLPALPPLWGAPAAFRARAVPLEGVKNGYVVLAVATAGPLGALEASHAIGLAIVAGLLLAGVVVGLLVRGAEAPAQIPEKLLAAAARIDSGDFSARAPALAGRLGTIASALNRAAELAGPAAASASAPAPEPSVARELPLPPAPEPPAPVAAPAPVAVASPAAGLLQAAAQTVAPATIEVDEETHWQQIFQDFLRTRASCGEATEGLTYEKFRLKLEGNKAALVAKYACKGVRFQVYVKEGKAALKATPVK